MTSDGCATVTVVPCRKVCFGHGPLARHVRPLAGGGTFLSQISKRKTGRPTAVEARRTTARFLALVADGHPFDEAARLAHVSPQRALKLVSSPLFADTVRRLRHAHLDEVAA